MWSVSSPQLPSRLRGAAPAIGVWQMLPGANVSRALAKAGVDWVMIDCEHGNIDDAAMHEAVPAVASCGVSPLVRIPDMQDWMIKRALDTGAHGILVPMLRSAEEAKKVVAAAKFPPVGQRGFGSPFAMERFHPVPSMTEYLQYANDSLLTMVQIETQEALDALEEIAAVPGIDLLFVGPLDLGNNIGYPILHGVMRPELEEAIDLVLTVAHKAGKKCGVLAMKRTDLASVQSPQFSRVNRVMRQACFNNLLCVHKGCGKTYTDPEEVCSYHPGPPVFHEGQKGWKCCKPRVLTFDEFLSIPPCTEGTHSTTDLPPGIEKKTGGDADTTTQSLSNKLSELSEVPTSAPSRAPLAPQAAPTAPPPPPESEDDEPSLDIPDGKVCRRKTCNVAYKKGQVRSNDEQCVHHPGVPIFHEGSKGYSCCKRRVLEFDQFMKIEGCKISPRHLFVGSGQDKKKGNGVVSNSAGESGEELLDTVRHDFYQTPSTVIASFFLKKIDKTNATVKFEAQELTLDLPTSDAAPKRYKTTVPLFGPIDTDKSSFKILGTKLEVSLYKADGKSWPVLRSDDRQTGEILQVGRAGQV
ncbi:Pyruvate/Phosphoenolpyruvate kinase-like domain-containing protein [Pseudomassariella vexata]|uniref:Pyruvate/Phosphoenolpyruvate kinase-like domain-containing protein n=1 Tax=Pseudomassariella vexata TaxID=1141098 RepID=A0A1Y2DST4_9PEZI|nr:Pyruvate/Phosphoenolpyruvate kinase-like domain-containing protein [Pseudomassariella vexata]ORY62214.1 Pyruvate/Phosphoenolpyruvate kinase-like domain-containing protein [Pseudomassariella vexata]